MSLIHKGGRMVNQVEDSEEKSDSEEKIEILNDGVSIRIGKNIYRIDNTVVHDKDWITLQEAAEKLGIKERQIKKKSAALSWEKKYTRLSGRLYGYVKKAVVEAYLASITIHDLKEEIQEANISPAPETSSEPVIPKEGEQKPLENNPKNELALKGTEKEIYLAVIDRLGEKIGETVQTAVGEKISTLINAQKETTEQLKTIETKYVKSERDVTLWKTSLIWLGGISIFIVIAGGVFGSRFLKSMEGLNAQVINQQDENGKLKVELAAKEAESNIYKDSLTKAEAEIKNTQPIAVNSASH
jgi:hypothetical protein